MTPLFVRRSASTSRTERDASLRQRISPSAKMTSANSTAASGDRSIFRARPSAFRATLSHAAWTAEPTLDTVYDPPSTGASGRDESPRMNVTCSSGSPRRSAAICVMIVYVPVPMSDVALETVSRPSAVRTAFAAALSCCASHTPVASPHPISVRPSRIDRGVGLRRDEPNLSAHCRYHARSCLLETYRPTFSPVYMLLFDRR